MKKEPRAKFTFLEKRPNSRRPHAPNNIPQSVQPNNAGRRSRLANQRMGLSSRSFAANDLRKEEYLNFQSQLRATAPFFDSFFSCQLARTCQPAPTSAVAVMSKTVKRETQNLSWPPGN